MWLFIGCWFGILLLGAVAFMLSSDNYDEWWVGALAFVLLWFGLAFGVQEVYKQGKQNVIDDLAAQGVIVVEVTPAPEYQYTVVDE